MATILVVDDQVPIQELMAHILEGRGHRVITCGNAESALAVTEPVDLLVVDFLLPGVNGRDLTARFRERHPTLPVVLMSGYLPSPDLLPPPPSTFMQKPVRRAVIVETIEEMLKTQ
jgi:DNA-binding NtrC family response regulator